MVVARHRHCGGFITANLLIVTARSPVNNTAELMMTVFFLLALTLLHLGRKTVGSLPV